MMLVTAMLYLELLEVPLPSNFAALLIRTTQIKGSLMKTKVRSSFLRYSLTSVLLLTPLFAGLTRDAKTLAACTSRNPSNLTTSVTGVHKIQVSWDVCQNQKNDFYQVSWGDSKDDIEQINDPTARSWTFTRARDLGRYTFKVRGCNAPTATKDAVKDTDCTPWSEIKVQAPDW